MTTALLIATLGAAAGDEFPDPLSLEQAEQIFLQKGLDLLVAEAQTAAAAGELQAARQLINPAVSAAFLYSFPIDPTGRAAATAMGTGASPELPGFSVSLTDNALLEHLISGKRGLRIEVATRALEVVRAQQDDARRALLAQLHATYLQALLSQSALALADEVQQSYAKTRALQQLRFDKGEISRAELARIASAQLEALQQRAVAAGAVDEARASLGYLLGARQLPLRSQLPGSLTAAGLPTRVANTPELLALARARRPDLRAAAAGLAGRAAALAEVQRQRLPDIALQVGYSQQYRTDLPNGLLGPPTLTIGLQAPLPLFSQGQGEIARAAAERQAAIAQAAKAEAQLTAEVAAAVSRFTNARERVARMEQEQLAQAKLARDLEELSYQKGEASLLDFLDAQRTYVATRLAQLQDLAACWTALYQLQAAIAGPLPPP